MNTMNITNLNMAKISHCRHLLSLCDGILGAQLIVYSKPFNCGLYEFATGRYIQNIGEMDGYGYSEVKYENGGVENVFCPFVCSVKRVEESIQAVENLRIRDI